MGHPPYREGHRRSEEGGPPAQDGIQGLILGGTELPLILTDGSSIGIPFLDTTQIHVNAILETAMA
ncbi:MAG TPA: hypothetical protein VGK21_14125 [Candidatus Angelobacter sp.]